MACEQLQQQLETLKEERIAILEEEFTPAQRTQHMQQLKAIGASISAAEANLKACLDQAAQAAQGALVAAPQHILEIVNVVTPAFVQQAKTARDAILHSISGGKTFPKDIPVEWKQPLAPDTEYDETAVAATGWAVNPRGAGTDFPFSHPFGVDWEFSFALDNSAANGSGPFDYLLAPGNKAPTPDPDPHDERTQDEGWASKLKLSFPLGLLGVEMDANNIPKGFTDFVKGGNRMAVYGRWIVDCAHPSDRCEIHPPLVMASAATTDAATTRALFTSRPFLVGDKYTTDVGSAYDDHSGDDGFFYDHLKHEIEKVGLFSTMVEAHPKVKSFPFMGLHLAHFQIRPPALKGVVASTTHHLQVSFNFTVRTGCAVQVTSSAADTIDVFIAMNQVGYKPPPLPHNSQPTISIDELVREDPGVQDDISSGQHAGEGVGALEGLLFGGLLGSVLGGLAGDLITSRGIKTDGYDSLVNAVNINSTQGAVMNVASTGIPPKAGIVTNDHQPFPVFGWLEAKWVSTALVGTLGKIKDVGVVHTKLTP